MLQTLMQDMNAGWWLFIVLAVVSGLFFIALRRQPNKDIATDKQNEETTPNVPKHLLKLSKLIKSHFPNYEVSTRPHHLLLVQQGQKVAVLTMDRQVAVGSRELGGVKVINLHNIPTKTQLSDFLQNLVS